MHKYVFVVAPCRIDNQNNLDNTPVQTLELSFYHVSFKSALRQLYKSLEFGEYFRSNTTA